MWCGVWYGVWYGMMVCCIVYTPRSSKLSIIPEIEIDTTLTASQPVW